jgi:hypothetical protein
MVFVLAAVLGAAAPASAKDKRDRRDRSGEWNQWNYRHPRAPIGRWTYPVPPRYGRPAYDRPAYDRHRRDTDPYRGAYRPYPYVGYGYKNFYGYRHPRSIVVPRHVFVWYPDYVTVVQPVVYNDVVLLPHHRYRVVERYPDRFLLIFGTGNLTVILRG